MNDPERNIACAFASAHLLCDPPVDIEYLAQQYVALEHAEIPRNIDGLLVRRHNQKSLVLISRKLAKNSPRYRFTLAHELGHHIIPWQLGTSLCHVDDQGRISWQESDGQEAEANRFAAELLIPSTWVKKQYEVRQNNLAQHILQIANIANVSPSVAMFATRRVARPGTICIIHDGTFVVYAANSPRSFCECPEAGMKVSDFLKKIDGESPQINTVAIGPRRLLTIELSGTVEMPAVDRSANSRDLLKGIVDSVGISGAERRSILGVINGKCSAVNTHGYLDSAEHMYAGLLRQFNGPGARLLSIVRHSEFNNYLALKAIELVAAHRNKTS